MEKDTRAEDYGPSHYDYNFDFDLDLRLKPFDYFLIVPYVLVIFPVVWVRESVGGKVRDYRAGKKVEETEVIFQSDFSLDALDGTYCLWPRSSNG